MDRDDLEIAEMLIRAGANVNAANRYGVTPLYLAALNGDADLILKLLKASAGANDAEAVRSRPRRVRFMRVSLTFISDFTQKAVPPFRARFVF